MELINGSLVFNGQNVINFLTILYIVFLIVISCIDFKKVSKKLLVDFWDSQAEINFKHDIDCYIVILSVFLIIAFILSSILIHYFFNSLCVKFISLIILFTLIIILETLLNKIIINKIILKYDFYIK